MNWFQLFVAIIGSGVATALVTGIFNIKGIKQTDKLNQKRFDNDQKTVRAQSKAEKDKASAQDLYRIIKGGLSVLPLVEKDLKYSPIYNYKNFAYSIITCVDQGDITNLKENLRLFFDKLIDKSKYTVNDKNIEDNKIIDYFLNLIISDVSKYDLDYQDFKARYMTSTYTTSGPAGSIGWNYKLDIEKLNKDIKFVNQKLNLHLEFVQSS